MKNPSPLVKTKLVNVNVTDHQGVCHLFANSSDKQLRDVVENGKNEQWKVILCAALDPNDAHVIDIKYHLKCWVKLLQRANSEINSCSSNIVISRLSAEVEFFALDTVSFSFWFYNRYGSGSVIIRRASQLHSVDDCKVPRRQLKTRLQEKIVDIELCRPTSVNKPEHICGKKTKDES